MKNLLAQARFGLAAESEDKGRDFVGARYYKHFSEPGWHILKSFIRRYGVDFRNEFAETPLMVAARDGNIALVRFLLDAGAHRSKEKILTILFNSRI